MNGHGAAYSNHHSVIKWQRVWAQEQVWLMHISKFFCLILIHFYVYLVYWLTYNSVQVFTRKILYLAGYMLYKVPNNNHAEYTRKSQLTEDKS